ncbi:D-aminoacyl-tRNA deacylase [Mycobacterium sp. OTB74]|jgi:D-tyrosyl-tRNA(Tyr) deacylase|uniref:D-aminoacyl-tRNA deacylase n=1 Tax=Mycobacterium sp. OTB74 TaxID=1853452 RepID=UPI0024765697|nr:D-aminoacyl-tRNA deacylase [Mycobacterium sp. OTB74]MDH6246503.1 D-Tyr-tRNAtyr deacylase [Mycobacterium sp. OTB74]
MRVVVQRVTSARVSVDGQTVGQISPEGQGLVALVGLTHSDDVEVARKMAAKIHSLRILDGELSAADDGEMQRRLTNVHCLLNKDTN